MSTCQHKFRTDFADGTAVIEYTYPDHLTLRAAAPGRQIISLRVDPNTPLALSVQQRTATAAFLARRAHPVLR